MDLGREKQTSKSKQVTILANEYDGAALILRYWTTALPKLRLDPDLLVSIYSFISS